MQPKNTQFLSDFLSFFNQKCSENEHKNHHSCDDWNAEGCRFFVEGDYKAALKSFSDAVYLSDQYHHYIHYECSATHLLLAKWWMDCEKWLEAKAQLDAAIFQDHCNVPAIALRVWIAERIDSNPQETATFTQQLRRFAPEKIVPTRWQNIAGYKGMLAEDSAWQLAIKHKDYPLAVHSKTAHDDALELMADNPLESAKLLAQVLCHPRAWRHYGEALMKSGQMPAAKDALEKAVAEHKRWHMAYHRAAATHRLNRGLAYEALGDALMAWQECAKAADIDKDWQEAKDQAARLRGLACA